MAQATRCGLLFYPPTDRQSKSALRPHLFPGGKFMLVLSRKRNESIIIDDNIVITVVEVRGDRVRLGIVAPREKPVHRMEVYEAIQKDLAEDSEEETDISSKIS